MTATPTIEYQIIQGAYLTGFEPSSDDLTGEALYQEAQEFLINSISF